MLKNENIIKRIINESSNPDFLMFVIKYLSYDPQNWISEWVYDGCYRQMAQCVCGKEGLATVFVVRNKITNKILSPIGSVCIHHFSKDIVEESEKTNLKLLEAIARGERYINNHISLSSEYLNKDDIKKFVYYNVISKDDAEICKKALNRKSASIRIISEGTDILVDKIIPSVQKSLNLLVSTSTASSENVYFDAKRRDIFENLYELEKRKKSLEEIIDVLAKIMHIKDVNYVATNENKTNIFNNEIKYIESHHKNFYEYRIIERGNERYLMIENHHDKEKNDYSSEPISIKIIPIEK